MSNYLDLPRYQYQAAKRRYFRAVNPTPGTGIAMGVQTSFSDTANALLVLYSATKQIYPDYLRLICTAAGASTTQSDLAIVTDTGDRKSAGGSALTVVSSNNASVAAATTVATFGAVTATAANAKRIQTRLRLKTQATPCWVAGDEVYVRFGAEPAGSALLSGTASARYSFDVGPVISSVAGSIVFHMWNTANAVTPPSWEVEVGFWEV